MDFVAALPYSDQNLDSLLANHTNLAKQPSFWKKRIGEHLAAATARWPELYKFNQAEDHRNFTFNRFANATRNLREAYLLSLYTFDILLPENMEYFGAHLRLQWFLKRLLPISESFLENIREEPGMSCAYLMTIEAPIDYIITFLHGRMIPGSLILGALLKYGKGPWFDRYLDNCLERKARLDKSVFSQAALEPEIKELIWPRLRHLFSKTILESLAEVQRILNLAKGIKEDETLDFNPAISLPMNYLDYLIFPFLSNFDKDKRTFYQILRALKGTVINPEAAEKSEKLPRIEIEENNDAGLLELASYLLEKDDPAILEHVLKCISTKDPEDLEACQNDLRAFCFGRAQPQSAIFRHLLKNLPVDYLIEEGPANFQAAYVAYTEGKFAQFAACEEGRFQEAMQILCPDFPSFDPDDCSCCSSENEDE